MTLEEKIKVLEEKLQWFSLNREEGVVEMCVFGWSVIRFCNNSSGYTAEEIGYGYTLNEAIDDALVWLNENKK